MNYSLSAQKQISKPVPDPFVHYHGQKKQIYNIQNIPKLTSKQVNHLCEQHYLTYQKLQAYIIHHTITVPYIKYKHCFRKKNVTLQQIRVTLHSAAIYLSVNYYYLMCYAVNIKTNIHNMVRNDTMVE